MKLEVRKSTGANHSKRLNPMLSTLLISNFFPPIAIGREGGRGYRDSTFILMPSKF
jgi:hypothetical protein